MFDERFQGVALRHRDVVAADAIAVAKLIDADQIGDGGLELRGISIERRLR
jgi:hypothetical protein